MRYRLALLLNEHQYHPLILKVLDTKPLQIKGFMGWKRSPVSWFGMLFLHTESTIQSYHMHTVPFDLDCIGLDDEDKVVEVLSLNAFEKAPRRFIKAVRNVVEVRGGWARDNGLKGGQRLMLI